MKKKRKEQNKIHMKVDFRVCCLQWSTNTVYLYENAQSTRL